MYLAVLKIEYKNVAYGDKLQTGIQYHIKNQLILPNWATILENNNGLFYSQMIYSKNKIESFKYGNL
jgi:hypothetical protein